MPVRITTTRLQYLEAIILHALEVHNDEISQQTIGSSIGESGEPLVVDADSSLGKLDALVRRGSILPRPKNSHPCSTCQADHKKCPHHDVNSTGGETRRRIRRTRESLSNSLQNPLIPQQASIEDGPHWNDTPWSASPLETNPPPFNPPFFGGTNDPSQSTARLTGQLSGSNPYPFHPQSTTTNNGGIDGPIDVDGTNNAPHAMSHLTEEQIQSFFSSFDSQFATTDDVLQYIPPPLEDERVPSHFAPFKSRSTTARDRRSDKC